MRLTLATVIGVIVGAAIAAGVVWRIRGSDVMELRARVAGLLQAEMRAKDDRARAEALLEKEVGFEGDMCACKTASCAKSVADRMKQWNATEGTGDQPRMTDHDVKVGAAIADAITHCMTTALGRSD